MSSVLIEVGGALHVIIIMGWCVSSFSESVSEKKLGASPNKHWQAKISSGFDRLVAFASTAIDRGKEIRRRGSADDREVAAFPKSSSDRVPKNAMHRQWVVDSVVHKDRGGASTHAKDNTLSLKFKVVHTKKHSEEQIRKLSTSSSSSDDVPVRGKGPRTPPNTPPRTPSPLPTLTTSHSSIVRDSTVSDDVLSVTPVSPVAREPHILDAARCKIDQRQTPPLNDGTDVTLESPYDRHFKKKLVQKGRNLSTKYQSKFRPKGKDWDWNQSSYVSDSGGVRSSSTPVAGCTPYTKPLNDSTVPFSMISCSNPHVNSTSRLPPSTLVPAHPPMLPNMPLMSPNFPTSQSTTPLLPPSTVNMVPNVRLPHYPAGSGSMQASSRHGPVLPNTSTTSPTPRTHSLPPPLSSPPLSHRSGINLEPQRAAVPRRPLETDYADVCGAGVVQRDLNSNLAASRHPGK